MWEFIILGQVPGTDLHLTFAGWLIGLPLLAAAVWGMRYARRHQLLHYSLVAVSLFTRLYMLRRPLVISVKDETPLATEIAVRHA